MKIKKYLSFPNISTETPHNNKIDNTITYVMIVFVIILFSSIQFFAQEKVENKKTKKANKTLIPNSTQAVNNKIEFKNDSGNSIMTVTDEGGNSGSINLPDVNSQLSGDKLYNNGGELYFGKNPVNSNSPDEDWEISGNDIYSKNSGNVGIGVTNPSSKLEVDGNTKTSTATIGSNGVTILEVIKLSSNIGTSGSTFVNYPTGFDITNTHVLSYKVKSATQLYWHTQTQEMPVFLNPGSIEIRHPSFDGGTYELYLIKLNVN